MENCAIVLTFWGSDLLRIDDDAFFKLTPLFEKASVISMGKNLLNAFKMKTVGYDNKLMYTFFGNSLIEHMYPIYQAKLNREKFLVFPKMQ